MTKWTHEPWITEKYAGSTSPYPELDPIADWLERQMANYSDSREVPESLVELATILANPVAERSSVGAGEWVLVPREPTEAMMLDAWTEAEASGLAEKYQDKIMRRVWNAMLAVAPSPEWSDAQIDAALDSLYFKIGKLVPREDFRRALAAMKETGNG